MAAATHAAQPQVFSAPEMTDAPPRRLGGYDLVREIARGGMGIVWLAVRRLDGREVALKLLPLDLAADPVRLTRFRAEANLSARLRHPNIVAIHEIGDDQGFPFFAMDYVEGEDLARLVRDRPMGPREAAELVRTVALAIQHAHDQGVLHRDLKPSNVLMAADGEPKVTDFGLAKLLDPIADLTLTGEILGSPCFMAPEQVSGRRQSASVRTDVYGLGGILYYALTGRPAFAGQSISATLQNVLKTDPPLPSALQPSVPAEIDQIVMRCLAKDPALRFPAAAQLASELERALRGQPLHHRAPGRMQRFLGWARREPGMAILGGGCLALAGMLVVILVMLMNHQETSRQRAERHEEAAAVNRYIAEVSLAGRAMAEGDLRTAVRLLDGVVPGPGTRDRRGFEWFLLRQKCSGSGGTVCWQGGEPVLDFAVTPALDRIVVAGPGTVRVVPARGALAERTHRLPGEARHRRIELSPDAQGVWVGDEFGLHHLDLGSGRIDTVISESVRDLAIDPTGGRLAVSVAGADGRGEVVVVSAADRRPGVRMAGVAGPVLEWMGTAELRGIADSGVRWTWSPAVGVRLGDVVRHEGGIVALAETRDRRRVAVVDRSGHLRIQDVRTGRIEREERLERWRGLQLAFASDGNRLVLAGGEDHRVTVRESPTWSTAGQLVGHGDRILRVRVLPEGLGLLTGSADRSVRRWSWEGTEVTPTWRDVPAEAPSGEPVFSPDGEWMSVGFGEGARASSRIWRVSDPDAAPVRLPGITVAFAPDSSVVMQSLPGGRLEAWGFQGRLDSVRFRLNPSPGSELDRISPDGGFFACLGADERLRLFHAVTGRELAGPVVKVRRFRISPDSRWILFTSAKGAGVFEPGTRDQKVFVRGDVVSFAFSPDSRHACAGLSDGRLTVFDLLEGGVVAEVDAQAGPITAAVFVADARTLLLGGEDGALRFWNVPSWREIARIQLPAPVFQLAARPGHRAFVTAGRDGLRLLAAGMPLGATVRSRVEGGFWESPFENGARLASMGPPAPLPAALFMR